MTWTDPIVEEVRHVREVYAARFNYDLQAMYRDLKEKEKRSGRKIVQVGESMDDQPGEPITGTERRERRETRN